MPSREQVALEPALAVVLAEDLHHAAVVRHVVVDVDDRLDQHAVLDVEDGAQPVRVRLVRAHEAEAGALPVAREHVAQELAEAAGRLVELGTRLRDGNRVPGEVGQVERLEHAPTVGVRVRAHAALAAGRELRERRHQPALIVEQLFGPVAAHPLLELVQVVGVVAHVRERHLVRTERALDRLAVDDLRAGPTLQRPQHDRRPPWPGAEAVGTGAVLDHTDRVEAAVERRREVTMHGRRVVAFDEVHVVPVAARAPPRRRRRSPVRTRSGPRSCSR